MTNLMPARCLKQHRGEIVKHVYRCKFTRGCFWIMEIGKILGIKFNPILSIIIHMRDTQRDVTTVIHLFVQQNIISDEGCRYRGKQISKISRGTLPVHASIISIFPSASGDGWWKLASGIEGIVLPDLKFKQFFFIFFNAKMAEILAQHIYLSISKPFQSSFSL